MSLAISLVGWWRERLYDNPPLPLSLPERLLIMNRAAVVLRRQAAVAGAADAHLSALGDAARRRGRAPCSALTLGAVALLWSLRRRAGKGPLVAAGFFVVMLGPVLGVVDFNYSQYSFVADHFQYVPSAGLIAAVAAGRGHRAAARRRGRPRRSDALVIGVLLLVLAGLSWRSAAQLRHRGGVLA